MNDIMKKLEQIRQATLLGAKDTLTVEECSLLTNYTVHWLHQLTSRREIPHFKKGNRVYFSKKAIERWLQSNPVPTVQETESQAATYVALHNNNKINH